MSETSKQPFDMKKTSVVILNWNGRKLLEEFLPVVIKHTLNDETQVVVADNASEDDSVAFMQSRFPDVPLIVLDKNYGFAEGYNKALKQVDAEYVVLLNSDVETSENWLSQIILYMDAHPEVCAAQPKILSQKQKEYFEYAGACGGFIDRLGYPFCRGRILNHVEKDSGQYNTVIPVFWATGACLCIRRKDYFDAGGLDARFFAHMEEIDLCWRLNARGERIVCLPQSVVYHVGGASLGKDNPKKTYLNFRNNLLMLYKNTESCRFPFILLARTILDILAWAHLLLEKNNKSAKAVIKAHLDFYKMKAQFTPDKKLNLSETKTTKIAVKYRGSIIWDFYFRGKKTYAAIFDAAENAIQN